MSRSGYSDDLNNWDLIRWRGQVKSAMRGSRGQRFFKDLLAALDALPEKRLIAKELETAQGEVCALGALGKHRGISMGNVDPDESEIVGGLFDIAGCLAQETVYENDECGPYKETPEQRYERVRKWAESNIRPEPAEGAANGTPKSPSSQRIEGSR